MLVLNDLSPKELSLVIASQVKSRRLELGLTQQGLARRAAFPVSTYRRFEKTGEISLQNLLLLAVALGATDDFQKLFLEPRYQNIDEVIQANQKIRQRGNKN